MMFGIFHLSWWGYFLVLMGFTQLTIFSVTIYLHRCQAHRSLILHPLISHVFRFWLWMTTGMETKAWAAIHRKHHAKVEKEGDPHSPTAENWGIKTVLLQGAELYKREAANKETLERYGEGTPDDWIERHVYARHSATGIVLMLIIDLALFGVVGLSIWALQMAWIPFFAAGVVNGIGHFWGYRNYESKDASRNVFPIGFFIGGEELHNNHHAFATSAKFSVKWWEFDMGWVVIRSLQLFGLAKPRRVVPCLRTVAGKTSIDTDTLKALIAYRLQVMAQYTHEVVLPALREERKQTIKSKAAYALLSRARLVLTRESSILEEPHKMRLAHVLENFQSLRVIYHFRLKLQDIWSRSTANQKELIEALQEWCQQAEASGMEALLKFSRVLKTYVPQETYAT